MSLNDLFHLSFRILGWVWHVLLQHTLMLRLAGR